LKDKKIRDIVRNHYSEYGYGEWERLVGHPYHFLELNTTIHFLKKYLPKKGLVLDAGGGPGRYTIELAKIGYDVILFDLTPKLLDIAKEKIKDAKVENRVKQIVEGSVNDLSMFEDNFFDAVICLGGPLCHLVYKEQRQRAADELVRVTKQKAPIFVSVIGRLAILMNTIVLFLPELEAYPDIWNKLVLTGDYFGGQGFTASHFYIPEELKAEFVSKTEVLDMVGLEGMFSTHTKEYNEVYEQAKYNEILWDTHLKTCTDPRMVGISEHFMLICRKK
jgi:ubiquinone/menaquinone biosynthesis C-methylase UbiE